jgi:hypothetical protein
MAPRAEITCPSLCKPLTAPCPTDGDVGAHPPRQPLPSLAPTALVPSCVSQRAQAMLALASIDKLRVVRSRHAHEAGERFVIELFTSHARVARRIPLATSARLPQVCSSPTASSAGCSSAPIVKQTQTPAHPTLAIEKRLAQFSDLRNALYLAVLSAHVRAPFCPYCRELINYSVWGNRLPTGLSARLLLMRDREETRLLALLETFTAELLQRTLRAGRPDAAASTPVGGFCSAKTEVPVLVHAFLFGQQQQ